MTAAVLKSGKTKLTVEKEKRKPSGNHTGLMALYHKELADHLRSKRFMIILLLIFGTSIASLYGALNGLSDAISQDSNFVFLKIYTTSGNSIPSFMSIIALMGPFVGLTLGFDAINSERNNGTLNRLVAQPIYRDAIIIGKFLAGNAVIMIMVFTMGIFVGAVGVMSTGLIPQTEEVFRVLAFLIFTVVYMDFWLGLSILFSVVCRHSATSAMAVIALWIFFTIFMSMVANIIANAVYPIGTQYQAMLNTMNNYTLQLGLNRISPYYLYSEAVSTIMNPTVRSVNVVTMQQLEGAISGYLSFGQSMLLVWPHLTGLVALMLAAFGGSYIGFMRQEIRN